MMKWKALLKRHLKLNKVLIFLILRNFKRLPKAAV